MFYFIYSKAAAQLIVQIRYGSTNTLVTISIRKVQKNVDFKSLIHMKDLLHSSSLGYQKGQQLIK